MRLITKMFLVILLLVGTLAIAGEPVTGPIISRKWACLCRLNASISCRPCYKAGHGCRGKCPEDLRFTRSIESAAPGRAEQAFVKEAWRQTEKAISYPGMLNGHGV